MSWSKTIVVEALVREARPVKLEEPLVVAGFAGPGWAGAMAMTHIIESLGLEEVASVKSRHVSPATVFEGGRLRHPFRIHASNDGKLVAVISELPLFQKGLYDIASALLDWVESKAAREIIVLEGIPSQHELPADRPTFCAAEIDKLRVLKERGIPIIEKGFIGGISGCILNECLSRSIEGVVFLTPVTAMIPDPQGAANLIEALNRAYRMSINTNELLSAAEQLRTKMKDAVDHYTKAKELEDKQGPEGVYA